MVNLYNHLVTSPLSPLVLPGLTGFFMVLVLVRNTPIRFKFLFLLALALPIGLGMSSLALFWSHELFSQHAKTASVAVMCTISSALILVSIAQTFLWRHPGGAGTEIDSTTKPRMLKGQTLLTVLALTGFLVYLFIFFDFILNRLTWNPVGGWDSRYVWNLKARFFVRSAEHWREMFSPLISSWSLRDYPLMLPGSIAWGWNWVGREILIWPGIVNITFFLSAVLLVIWYVSSVSVAWYGLLAGTFLLSIPAFQTWTAALYADIPLAFFFTASGITCLLAARTEKIQLAWLSGFLAGLSVWTKNEGLFFCGWLSIVFFLLIAGKKQLGWKIKGWFVISFMIGLVVPVLTTLYLKHTYGGLGIYLGNTRGLHEYWSILTNAPRTLFVLASMVAFKFSFALWRLNWALFFLALVLYPIVMRQKDMAPHIWALPLLALLIDVGYIFIFQITPLDLKSHIQWALSRLLLHNGILALLFAFEIFKPSAKKNSAANL